MSVSLDQVIAAAERRLAPLTAECAGHAILAVADQVVRAPSLVEGEQLSLEENGTVRIARGTPADELECERCLRALLDRLMRVARGGGGALFRAAMRESAGDLARFVREMEAALIPANRAAARRSLARLHRETLRAMESGSLQIPLAPTADRAPTTARASSEAPRVHREPEPLERATPPASPVVAAEPAVASPVSEPEPAVLRAVVESEPALAKSGPPPESPLEAQPAVESLEIDVHVSPEPPAAAVAEPSDEPASDDAPGPTREPEELCTPLEPVLRRVRDRESLRPVDEGHTPYLGTRIAQLAPPPLPAVRPSALPEPASFTRFTAREDSATDPMPEVAYLDDEQAAEDEIDDEALTPYLDRAVAYATVEARESVSREDDSVGAAMASFAEQGPSAVVEALADEPAEPEESEASELPPGVVRELSPRPIPTSTTPAAPRYTRKSDVSELLRNFSVADPEPSHSLLRDLKGLAGLEPSKTPPPVAVGLEDDVSSEEQKPEGPSIRPIATVTVVGTFLCVAAFAGPRVVSAHSENSMSAAAAAPAPVAAPISQPSPCTASLSVVGAPSDARIEVRPQLSGSSVEPQWATGPEATFSQLPCAKPFEVLVRSGADEKRHWTRVPISAAELTPASPKSAGAKLEVDVTRRELY